MKCGAKNLAIAFIMIYTFFFQAFFNSSIAKYTIFVAALCLIIWENKRIRISVDLIVWLVLIGYMVIRSKSFGDLPIFIGVLVVFGMVATVDDSWGNQFFKIITICVCIHSAITILCWIVPYLHSNVIVPLFFNNLAGRAELTYKAGLTNHYSTNGMYLGLGFVCSSINAIICSQSEKKKAIIWTVVILFALILTTKRTHLAAAVLSSLVVFLIYSKHQGKLNSGIFKACILIVSGISAFLIAAVLIPSLGAIVDRFVELGEDDTLHGRTYFYEIAYNQWRSNPIFGSGWGGFSEAFNKTPLGLAYIKSGYTKIQPHNVYLQLLSDLGIFGLGIFIFIVGSAFYKGTRIARTSVCPKLIYVCIGIIVYVLICGFTGNPLNDVQLYCPFILSCMCIYAKRIVQ